jgi:hypothetical protein
MNASIVLLALWGAVAPQTSRPNLIWEQDYRQARTVGSRLQKPLAVFVGKGADGWKQLVREGTLDAAVRKTLAERFVPVYINQDLEAGQQMAEAFGLSGKLGLIISDRSGDVMAFRHEGNLDGKDLARHLKRLADPDHVVVTTETNEQPVVVQPATIYQSPFACQT